MAKSRNVEIVLPTRAGGTERHTMRDPVDYPKPDETFTARTVLAAPHVVAQADASYTPGVEPPVDWEATFAFRRHLWSYGIGVADAMDTSERGPGGLSWPQAQELIAGSIAEARRADGLVLSGAGTEQLPRDSGFDISAVVDAYLEQVGFIEGEGGATILRSSHELLSVARDQDDFLDVYSKVLAHVRQPALVHWLGTGFDPTLEGYWGHADTWAALEVVVELAEANRERLRGIKFSVLDTDLEAELRRRLPAGLDVYTGDDYDYPRLILGDGDTHSQGLLGVFDPIAPVASRALQALEAGDEDGYLKIMESTLPLALRMFEPPAAMYKTGTVFIAYLSGHQGHFRMVSGREGMRSALHLTDLFRLADDLGLFPDPPLAAHRMRLILELSGIS